MSAFYILQARATLDEQIATSAVDLEQVSSEANKLRAEKRQLSEELDGVKKVQSTLRIGNPEFKNSTCYDFKQAK